ncbi:MAG: GNAT family N-acetyltransferase [Cytophagales bacterium]|nr:GNAT family N-acetyltransferase [Rhizobacter sp.]
MNVLVRLARPEDLPALLVLYRQLHPDDPDVDLTLSKAVFDGILASPHFELFVAEADGVVAATCYLNVIPNLSRKLAPYAVLENVVTDQALRNQGIGKAIVGHALHLAWQRGCYKVMLLTGSRKESTHQFYRACGFLADEKFAFVAKP